MRTFFLITSLLLCNFISSQKIEKFFTDSDKFFNQYVFNGKVDYKNIKQDTKQLDELIKSVESFDLNELDINVYKAFWINIYNLVVIKSIIDSYPIKSTIDTKGFFDGKRFQIGNDLITLQQIEKTKLKSTFKDPLLNFVLVCGAKGCPPLLNVSYKPESINDVLEKKTFATLNDPNFVKIDFKNKTIEISEMFDWYKEDFISKETRIIDFINKYRMDKIPVDFKIIYFKYDWNLNQI